MEINEGPFSQWFCWQLEEHLSMAFFNSDDPLLNRLWCDGVVMPDDYCLWKKRINDKRHLVTKAWIVDNFDMLFEMTIKFGPRALSRYARGLSLMECVPSAESTDWITLDRENLTIVLQFK